MFAFRAYAYSFWAGLWTSLGAWVLVSGVYWFATRPGLPWYFLLLAVILAVLVQLYPGWAIGDMGGVDSETEPLPGMLFKLLVMGWLSLILLVAFHLISASVNRNWWMNYADVTFFASVAILLTKAASLPLLVKMPAYLTDRNRRWAKLDKERRNQKQHAWEEAERLRQR